MNFSEEAQRLMRDGGLVIELEAIVASTRTFKANGQDVAKVIVVGTPGGPTGHNVQCNPYGIFELDAEMGVFHKLGDLAEPGRFKFRADLKLINSSGGYAVHLLEVMK